MRRWSYLALTGCIFAGIASGKDDFQESYCVSTREFITTMEFLRTEKAIAVPEKEARQIAAQVSGGCTGAARRFIHVTHTLVKAGLGAKDAILSAIWLSHKTDAEADTFTTIFQKAFLSEYLDLDLQSAMKLAYQLSADYKLSAIEARDDFEKIIQYCVRAKGLDLPRPQCGTLAVQVAKRGDSFGGGIAPSFIRTVEFIRSPKGAARSTGEALKIADEIMAGGPNAAENFIRGYQYALAKNGLNLGVGASLGFAKAMASKTLFARAAPLKPDTLQPVKIETTGRAPAAASPPTQGLKKK